MHDNEIRKQLIANGNIKTNRDVTATQWRKEAKKRELQQAYTPPLLTQEEKSNGKGRKS